MNKLFSWCRKKMTKENMIVLALSGVLLMVVAIPTGKEKNKTDESKSVQLDTQTVTMDSESNSAQQEAMEEKLAQFLSRMEGAGRVEVLITYASTEEQVIEKETPSVTNSQTSENDAGAFMLVYSLVAIVGATMDLGLMWSIAETFNGLMAIPNLIAVFLLSGVVVKLVKEYFADEGKE